MLGVRTWELFQVHPNKEIWEWEGEENHAQTPPSRLTDQDLLTALLLVTGKAGKAFSLL